MWRYSTGLLSDMCSVGILYLDLLVWLSFGISANGYVQIETQLEDRTVDIGDDASFICNPSTYPSDAKRLLVQWKHNENLINFTNTDKYEQDETKKAIVIRDVNKEDAGIYTCIALVGIKMDISSAKLIVRDVPDPPIDVQIISCPSNTAELFWRSGNSNGYPILRHIVQFNTSDAPSHWYTYDEQILQNKGTYIVNLRPWGMYSFRMLAINKMGTSNPSNPTKKRCAPPPSNPDRNPTDVRTRRDQTKKLIIEWTPMDRLYHNGPGFYYLVSWRHKGSIYWNSENVKDPSASELQVDVADTYGLYEIKVRAVNGMGESSQPAFVIIGYSGEGRPLVVPKDFRIDPAYDIQPHKAHFVWEVVDTSEEMIRGEFKGYKLQYWKSSEGRHKLKAVDIFVEASRHITDVRAAIENLPAYTALRAQVAVMNSHFVGPPSQTINFFTPEGTPGPVQGLRVETFGATYVLLKWQPPNEPNGALLGFDIAYQSVDQFKEVGPIKALKPQINNPSTLGARITGLDMNHNYRFYVWARTGAGKGTPEMVDIKTADADPPDKPRPKIASVDARRVNLTWTTTTKQDIGFSLEYRQIGENTWEATQHERERQWKVVDNLEPGTKYQFRVVARNELGDTAASVVLLVQTPSQDNGSHYEASNGKLEGPFKGSTSAAGSQSFTIALLTQAFTVQAIVFKVFH